jgi:hypothetical protein
MRFIMVFIAAGVLSAQGTTPKSKATEYPVHVQVDTVTLAARYLVHSLPTSKETLIANDYLVVEVAFYGPPFGRVQLSPDMFTLRINGRGALIPSLPPRMVVASIRTQPGGQPTAKSTVRESEQQDSLYYRLDYVSVPEGERTMPFSGLLYFPYRGSTQSIQSLQLLFEWKAEKATLKLLP